MCDMNTYDIVHAFLEAVHTYVSYVHMPPFH